MSPSKICFKCWLLIKNLASFFIIHLTYFEIFNLKSIQTSFIYLLNHSCFYLVYLNLDLLLLSEITVCLIPSKKDFKGSLKDFLFAVQQLNKAEWTAMLCSTLLSGEKGKALNPLAINIKKISNRTMKIFHCKFNCIKSSLFCEILHFVIHVAVHQVH